jgi:glutamyl-tRNA synthetase
MSVRTRFAPSPTGYLHIGGVRTAMFNWLFAKGRGGQFLLRIDDTDQVRNIDEALGPILHGFRWLGLEWDEGPEVGGPRGPYFQSQKSDRYQQAVNQLLEIGAAYRDFARPEELQAERDEAQRAGKPFRYSRRWKANTPEEAERFRAEGREVVVRLLMPSEGELVLDDLVKGEVRFPWISEQDHVIQRADGTCLYHLATVVDDEDMAITHVIRAEEHLSNTPRQVFMAQQLGYTLPQFAHLPLVAEPGSKSKLSKRKLDQYLKNREFATLYERGRKIAERLGLAISAETFNPVVIDFYETTGFLPEAVLNYLVLLGWSLDDSTETFTRDDMLRLFSLDRIGRAAASFDANKLLAFQQRAMNALPLEQKVPMCLALLEKGGLVPSPCDDATRQLVEGIVAAAGDRIVIAGDIFDYDDFFTADDQLPYDEKTFEKRLRKPTDAAGLLQEFRDELAQHETWSADSLDQALHAFVERKGVGIGQIIHALRVAVTGKGVGFGMFDTLALLGRERTLSRIDRTLARVTV